MAIQANPRINQLLPCLSLWSNSDVILCRRRRRRQRRQRFRGILRRFCFLFSFFSSRAANYLKFANTPPPVSRLAHDGSRRATNPNGNPTPPGGCGGGTHTKPVGTDTVAAPSRSGAVSLDDSDDDDGSDAFHSLPFASIYLSLSLPIYLALGPSVSHHISSQTTQCDSGSKIAAASLP